MDYGRLIAPYSFIFMFHFQAPVVSIPWNLVMKVAEENFEIMKEEIIETDLPFSQGDSMKEIVMKCPFIVCKSK